MVKEKRNLQIVQMSLTLLSKALNELKVVNELKGNVWESKMMNVSPFSFYRVSLQYIVIMEFSKLLEPDTKDNDRNKENWRKFENKNAANLSKLSRMIYDLTKDSYLDDHNENKKKLDELRGSQFYDNLKNERNKKIGHSDSDYNGKTYGIKTFSEEEINEAFIIQEEIMKIYKRCSNACDVPDFLYHKDDGTRNFIDYHIVYNEYYNENLMKAVSEGYTINSKRNGSLGKKSS